MPNLRLLNLSSNKIAILPEFLWERLGKLRSLDLCANEIQRIPVPRVGFGGWCENLERLDLSWNKLGKAGLCQELGTLTRLRVLDLASNLSGVGSGFERIPKSLAGLHRLESLSLEQFVSKGNFPMEVCEIKSLQCFSLASAGIRSLPLEFCRLRDLTFLDISANNLTELPASLFLNATCLRSVKASWNKLTDIPPEIENCQDLQVLQVAHNELERLPETLTQCAHLRVLHCSYNDAMDRLPETIGSLQELQVLKCVASKEHDRNFLPDSFVRLESLRSVLLSHNPGVTQKLMCWQWLPVIAVHSQTPANFKKACLTILCLYGIEEANSTLSFLPRDLVLLIIRWLAHAWDDWPVTSVSDRL